MSTIATFYSFKGGVGRSMALANISVLLLRRGLKVLAVDWDLEAPGLDRYFSAYNKRQSKYEDCGLLDLLLCVKTATSYAEWPNWRRYLTTFEIESYNLDIILAGRKDQQYVDSLQAFDWSEFFEQHQGGEFLEILRNDWLAEYDVVLIDSRTGFSNSGGVCTIFLPDVLIAVFTASYQSLHGVRDAIEMAQRARQHLEYDRMPLSILPLPSRWDGRSEVEESRQWLRHIEDVVGKYYNSWLPINYTPAEMLERTKVPYVALFSFGERLPALTHGITDADFPGYAYDACATLLASGLKDAAGVFGPSPTIAIPAIVPIEYLDWLRRGLERVELLGVKEGRSVTLSSVYVPALTRRPTSVLDAKGIRERGLKASGEGPIALLRRLDEESLYVVAPAGSGKSTFCRWVALQSIASAEIVHPVPAPEEFAEPLPANLRGRLPLVVPLREFWRSMDRGRGQRTWKRGDVERALAAWIDASPPEGLTGALLRAHLAAGTALLLLDGLDEVAVTDIRDGVTLYPRELLLSGLADALPGWLNAGNRVLLTSRPYGLDVNGLNRLGLPMAELEPLPEALQNLFVRRWFHTLGKLERIEDLVAVLHSRRPELAPLIENPMLLTAVCVLYDTGGRLPDDRYELYRNIVAGVLHNRYPGEAAQRDPVERRLEAVALGMHQGDADDPRLTPAAEIGWVETERLLARFAALNPAYETGSVEVAQRREELLNRSGLLVPRPNERAAFILLSFQEFLAAQRLARTADDIDGVFRARRAVPEWRATLLFLFAAQIANRDAGWGLRLLGRLVVDQDRAAVKANPATAVFIAEALELCLAKKYAVPPALAERFRHLALEAIEDEVELKSRQALGLCLGRLGDPRIRSLRDPAAYVEVPAGVYPFGKKGETFKLDTPFCIGRYPVTNSQFGEFIEDGGYRERRWWSDDGWAWLQEEKVTEPDLWRDGRLNGPNQPVVGVSFWEAEACSAWAGGRLPSEREWEAAARGSKGHRYPWGEDWEDGICNTREVGFSAAAPVGLFPRSRQADLWIEDLAGNVWDWCASLYGPNDNVWPGARVLRGGCWIHNRDVARSTFRDCSPPLIRDIVVGFRVLCLSPIKNTDP